MRITTKENDIESILYSEKQIAAMVETLGETLTRDYAGSRPVMVCVLKGASIFFTDLCREMDCNIDMDFITVSSYGASSKSSGVVKLTKDIDVDITGRDVVIVEGAYSLHPALRDAYDLKVFLSVDAPTQRARILARNGEKMLQRFLKQWIPLENVYFEACAVRDCCDIIL